MLIQALQNLTVTEVVSANRLFNSPVGSVINRSRRSMWGIALKTEGKTFYLSDDKSVLSDALHPVILPKGSSYRWTCREPGECLIIEFEAPFSSTVLENVEISDNSVIVNGFSKLEKHLSGQKAYDRAEALSLIYQILSFLIRSYGRGYAGSAKKNALEPAIAYLSDNYFQSDVTNRILADQCEMNEVTFRKNFESVYGVSPIRYLHHFRTQKAKDLLSSDYGSIGQVAYSCGYNSIYHFSKMFKHYTGQSPSEFAKSSALLKKE